MGLGSLGLGLGLLVSASSGCVPAVGPAEGGAEATPHAQPEPSARDDEADANEGGAGALEVVVDGAPAGPPTQRLGPMEGRGHARVRGWSDDGRRFGYCRVRSTDDACEECRVVARDGEAQTLVVGEGCAEGVSEATLQPWLRSEPAPTAAGEAPRWAAGAAIVLVVETREVEQTNAGQPRPMLKLGARRRDADGPTVWLLHVDPCEGCGLDQQCAASAHVDAIEAAPDGEELLVLVHLRRTDGSEELRAERLSATRVRAAVRGPASGARGP